MLSTFVSPFTPNLMSGETLEAIFVEREDLVRRLMELTEESAATGSKHHSLLIGPRGIGKTHLIALLHHRIKGRPDLDAKLRIAWLREEDWGIASFQDLLMSILRALTVGTGDPDLTERVEGFYALPASRVEGAARSLLKEYVGDRTLLLLAENLDDLFRGLGDEGQKRWRSYLQENPFSTIVATAQGLFNGVSLHESPFYGFFAIEHLDAFDLKGAADLLAQIAAYRGDDALADYVSTPVGRARVGAIHHLVGGSPRVYVAFSQFLCRESLDGLVEPFIKTLDDLTPYYQHRMRLLTPQQRKIIAVLCDQRRACAVREIARRCFISPQTASSQLKDLREKQCVVSTEIGRDAYYEMHEPLMRMCVELMRSRGEPIRLFVDFLRFWQASSAADGPVPAQSIPAGEPGSTGKRVQEVREHADPYGGSARRERSPESLVRDLLTRSDGARAWSGRVATLIGEFALHGALPALGTGLVRAIPGLFDPMVSDAAAFAWLDAWRTADEATAGLRIPLRLLEVAVRYRVNHDRRALMALPVEERRVLDAILSEVPWDRGLP